MSFPLHKDQLLSPLSDDLILLGKKDAGYVSASKSDSKSKHHILGVSDAQKCGGKFSSAKPNKEKLKERGKYMPPSNGNHILSNTEKEADNESCEELVSKTLKLPLLSCLSPSYIHPAKETASYVDDVEGTLRGKNNGDIDAALIVSKPELEDKVVAFPDGSVQTRKDVDLTEGETSRSKREKAPSVEHVHHSSVDKVSESEARNEEQSCKSKLPKAHKSVKGSSRNSLRGKDAAVNISNMNVSDKLQEDIGGSEYVCKGFSGDSGESKEDKQSSLALKAKKENISEGNGLKESFSSVKNDEEACNRLHSVCEPDSKLLTNSSDLNEDRHSTKQSVRMEVNNKHSDEGIIYVKYIDFFVLYFQTI